VHGYADDTTLTMSSFSFSFSLSFSLVQNLKKEAERVLHGNQQAVGQPC
jgi:hypothetical protein